MNVPCIFEDKMYSRMATMRWINRNTIRRPSLFQAKDRRYTRMSREKKKRIFHCEVFCIVWWLIPRWSEYYGILFSHTPYFLWSPLFSPLLPIFRCSCILYAFKIPPTLFLTVLWKETVHQVRRTIVTISLRILGVFPKIWDHHYVPPFDLVNTYREKDPSVSVHLNPLYMHRETPAYHALTL